MPQLHTVGRGFSPGGTNLIEPNKTDAVENDTTSTWRLIGRFDFDGHGEFWNLLPNEPGLYRLRFDEKTYYVGQGKSIFRRLGDYYQPGQGIEIDHRINRALKKFGGADVEVITGIPFADVSKRHKFEGVEIDSLRAKGLRVLNGRPDCVENLRDRIEYHQYEIAKLETKIDELMAKPNGKEL